MKRKLSQKKITASSGKVIHSSTKMMWKFLQELIYAFRQDPHANNTKKLEIKLAIKIRIIFG